MKETFNNETNLDEKKAAILTHLYNTDYDKYKAFFKEHGRFDPHPMVLISGGWTKIFTLEELEKINA